MKVTLTYRQIEQIAEIISSLFVSIQDGKQTVNKVNGLTGVRLRKIGRQLGEQFKEYEKDKKDILDSYLQTDDDGNYIPKKGKSGSNAIADMKLITGKKKSEVEEQLFDLLNKQIEIDLDRYLTDRDYEGLDLNVVELDLLDLISK